MDAGLKAESEGTGIEADMPPAKRLGTLFQSCLTRPQSFVSQMKQNRDARFNYWPGQSWDGRKWNPAEGDSEVIPWRGASDMRVPMVDGYVNEDLALAVVSLLAANLTVTGHNTTDEAFSTRSTNVLKWMLEDEMSELYRETNLLGNYHFERGRAVMGVHWERQVQMGYEELTMEMVVQMSQGAAQQLQQLMQPGQGQGQQPGQISATSPPAPLPPSLNGGEGSESPNVSTPTAEQVDQLKELANLPALLQDPSAEGRLVELLQKYADTLIRTEFAEALGQYEEELLEDYQLPKGTAKRILAELKEDGRTKIPVPTVKRNRPVLVALALDEDFFIPVDGTDLENNRACFWREWLTKEQLLERKVSEGWDADWVNYIVKHGKGSVGPNATPQGAASGSFTGSQQAHGKDLLQTENLYGIVHGYDRRVNDDGVLEMWYTVFHPAFTEVKGELKSMVAKTCLLDYAHGEYPFVLFRREFLSRRVDDSRGYGEIAYYWQKQIKTELDGQIDRASIATIPPLHHPKGRPPGKWGPGVKVPGSKADYAFAEIPQPDSGSDRVTEMVQRIGDRYFGRQVEGGDPVMTTALRQHAMTTWLKSWLQVYTQIFQLMQQYLPDEFYYRVVGSSQGQTIHAKREEIQGKFSVALKYDTQRLDPQVLEQKIKAITTMVQMVDRNGITDYNQLLAMLLSWIDPDVPDRILKPAEAATQQEVDDEQAVFAKIWAGIGVDVKPGQAYQLRLQVLNDAIAGRDPKTNEPKNPAALARYGQDPAFKKLVDDRKQQLQFQIEQQQNAVTGRLGAEPASMGQAPQNQNN